MRFKLRAVGPYSGMNHDTWIHECKAGRFFACPDYRKQTIERPAPVDPDDETDVVAVMIFDEYGEFTGEGMGLWRGKKHCYARGFPCSPAAFGLE